MNQETPNPLFEGFKPQMVEGGDPIDKPFTEPVGKKKRKSSGKKKKAAAAPMPVVAEAIGATVAATVKRKPRAPKAEKRAPKFELQAILAATGGLKDADMAGFEKGLNILMDANAAGRARLLAAWAKVFA